MSISQSTTAVEDFEDRLAQGRVLVVRHCTRFTGDPHVAEDLAQEVLLVAWRNRHKLYTDSTLSRWLMSIARNVCLHWARSKGRELRVRALNREQDGALLLTDDFDLEEEHDRQEVAELVGHVLSQLSPDTRTVLVRHYMEQEPQAEISTSLGMSLDAVESRLRRGRRLLRTRLTTELGEEFALRRWMSAGAVGWEETRVWCAECGRRTLMIQRTAEAIRFWCPECSPKGEPYHTELPLRNRHFLELVGRLRQPRRILDETLRWSHEYYAGLPGGTERPCTNCGRPLLLQRYGPDLTAPVAHVNLRADLGVFVRCERCHQALNASLGALLDALPQVREFHRSHRRVSARPMQILEVDGGPRLVGGYETPSTQDRIDVVVDGTTFAPVCIHSALG